MRVDAEYAIIDFETTDYRPKLAHPLEVAITFLDMNLNPVGSVDTLIKFVGHLGAQHIHQISPEMMTLDCPTPHEVAPALSALLDNKRLIAHNAPYDSTMLLKLLAAHGGVDPNRGLIWIDTLAISRQLLPQLTSHKLENIMRAFGFDNLNNHAALTDTLSTAYLLQRCAQEDSSLVPTLASFPRFQHTGVEPLPDDEQPWLRREQATELLKTQAPTKEAAMEVRLLPGDHIAFTGFDPVWSGSADATAHSLDAWMSHLSDLGYKVDGNLTKRSTRLLVAINTHTLSGKAQNARRWGIPIVDERQLVLLYGAPGSTGTEIDTRASARANPSGQQQAAQSAIEQQFEEEIEEMLVPLEDLLATVDRNLQRTFAAKGESVIGSLVPAPAEKSELLSLSEKLARRPERLRPRPASKPVAVRVTTAKAADGNWSIRQKLENRAYYKSNRTEVKDQDLMMLVKPTPFTMATLVGKTVCFTGDIPGLTRAQVRLLLANFEIRTLTSFTKNVEYLILGLDASFEKRFRAQQLGVPELDWQDLVREIKSSSSSSRQVQ